MQACTTSSKILSCKSLKIKNPQIEFSKKSSLSKIIDSNSISRSEEASSMKFNYTNPDEVEVINDAGFVYKRQKRSDETPTDPLPLDPSLERKRRRERKKTDLLKLKQKYQNEIRLWELLSNTLEDAHKNAVPESFPTTSFDTSGFNKSTESNTARKTLVDDLLAQAEEQEAIISNVAELCGVVEVVLNVHEERMRKEFMDLPVWEPSPNELMKALCEQ